MKKLSTLVTVVALATTLAAAGCKKKDAATGAPNMAPPAKTAPKAAEPAKAPTPAPAPTAAPTGAPTATVSTGIPECDAYQTSFAKLIACPKLPAAAADGMKQSFESTKKSWELPAGAPESAKTSIAASCKTSTDALKTTATSLGCEI